ncbi:MAG: tetratricopeptide repeat protein [Candidatus Hydrogenedens sp.]|nr:tetratricopeptide repeat protein [Candidatus Hydrogenedens sp.]
MRFWLEDPFHALALTLKKSWYFWGPHIISDSKVVHFEKEYSPVLRFLPGFTIIAALALSGLFFLFTVQRGLNQKTSLLLIFILSYFLSVLPFFMSERYRFPIVPFLLPLSALALIHLETALREKSGKHFIGKSFLILLLLILLSTELFPYKANESTWYLHRGFAFAGKQQTTEALACFEKALTVNPANGEAGLQAGYIHAARGDHDQALQFYLSALGSMPGNPYLMNNLGYEFYLKKDYPAAIRYYEQALARRQRYALAWHNLGNVFLETEEYEQARDAFQHACELDPENADSANNLGAALLRNNEVQASLEWFYRALESPSPYPRAHLNLGRALETLDRYTEAREHYESCLEYWPDNQAAVEGLMRLPSPAEAP